MSRWRVDPGSNHEQTRRHWARELARLQYFAERYENDGKKSKVDRCRADLVAAQEEIKRFPLRARPNQADVAEARLEVERRIAEDALEQAAGELL